MVTDFVEHNDDAVDMLERVGDFSRRRHCTPHLREKCPGITLQHYAGRLRNNPAAMALYEELEAALASAIVTGDHHQVSEVVPKYQKPEGPGPISHSGQ
jgi:hypothetical protein